MPKIELIMGDCLEKMKDIPDGSIAAVITDPPYGIGFMGKKWDELPPGKEVFEECLRVLKPGGYLLSFGGTRTYHRMACAIEDAGFEIRDMIEWVYGSGFPKSLSVGKAIDKLQGNERVEIGTYAENSIDGAKRTKNPDIRQVNYGASDVWDKQQTKGTSEWEGWGTALKPAHEPICMARKPLSEKTVALNVLKYGTGGINIDESRVVADWENDPNKRGFQGGNTGAGRFYDENRKVNGEKVKPHENGRFPANLIHDNSEEVRECFPETKTGAVTKKAESVNSEYAFSHNMITHTKERPADSGNASRLFKSIIYQAKASKAERNKGCEGLPLGEPPASARSKPAEGRESALGKPRANNHPTVKPIALMEYLIKMVTPKGGTVLDPFMGSGTTGVACKNLNRDFIGIELDTEYFKIAEKRINENL